MKTEEGKIICGRCGYHFLLSEEVRCPRCFEPVLKMSSCSGRCHGCREECHSAVLKKP